MDKDICLRLKEIRKERGMTQENLADALNYVKTTVSNYENGHNDPSVNDLKKIARALNISVDYLLCVTDIKRPYYQDENSPAFNSLAEGLHMLSDVQKEYLIHYMKFMIYSNTSCAQPAKMRLKASEASVEYKAIPRKGKNNIEKK